MPKLMIVPSFNSQRFDLLPAQKTPRCGPRLQIHKSPSEITRHIDGDSLSASWELFPLSPRPIQKAISLRKQTYACCRGKWNFQLKTRLGRRLDVPTIGSRSVAGIVSNAYSGSLLFAFFESRMNRALPILRQIWRLPLWCTRATSRKIRHMRVCRTG